MAKYIQKFIKGAKRLEGERESGPNDTERGGEGAKDSGRKRKRAKRLGGERESGRNDPDPDSVDQDQTPPNACPCLHSSVHPSVRPSDCSSVRLYVCPCIEV